MDMLLEENLRLRKLSDRQGDQIAELQHRVNDLLRLVYGVKSERFLPQAIPGMQTLPFAYT